METISCCTCGRSLSSPIPYELFYEILCGEVWVTCERCIMNSRVRDAVIRIFPNYRSSLSVLKCMFCQRAITTSLLPEGFDLHPCRLECWCSTLEYGRGKIADTSKKLLRLYSVN
jgi:hypothetical protein